jgi:tetratricopeptide (TPR) repeat protein
LGGIAWCYFLEARQGWTDDREGWIRKGIEFAEKAIEMDPKQPLGYMQLGNIMQLQGDHDRAIAFREKAVELAPNDMAANWGFGVILYKAGQAERGLEYLKRTERLAPRHPVPLLWSIQEAQFLAGQYEQSIEAGKRAIARNAEPTFPHVLLVAAYGALGRTEESQAEAATILKSDPSFTVTKFMRTRSYKNQPDLDRLSGPLIKAGLPE